MKDLRSTNLGIGNTGKTSGSGGGGGGKDMATG
jgi:hypothetical protein